MDKYCRICHNTSCSNHGKNVSFLGDGWKCNYIPVPTNADRIRSMTDEELAILLNKIVVNHHIKNSDNCNHCHMKGAEPCDTEGIIDWLKQPSE